MNGAFAARDLAVVRGGDGSLSAVARPTPRPAANDVVFRVLAAAVCGTDRQIVRGERPDAAAILGHEGVGEVAAIGAAVADFAVGERFVFNPVAPGDQDEILGHSTAGLFQQHLALDARDVRRRALAEPLPPEVPLPHAALAEPLGTVVYTHELMANVAAPRSLLIVGAGPIAILHALYAQRCLGIPTVRVVCRDEARARWLTERHLLAANDLVRDPAAAPAGFAAAVLCTPARATAAALAAALPKLADGAAIALVAGIAAPLLPCWPDLDLARLRRANTCGHPAPPATIATTDDGRRVHLFGHRGTAGRHLRRALEVLRAPFWSALYSHRIPLPALPDALMAIAAGRPIAGAHYVKGFVDVTAHNGEAMPWHEVAS